MSETPDFEDIDQIDCNNPNVDWAVVARLGGTDEPLAPTTAGMHATANHEDGVPYGCPLTQDPDEHERTVESFVTVCQDCPCSFVSYAVSVEFV